MRFRTVVEPLSSDSKIDFNSPVVTAGSCFAENIHNKLQYYLFKSKSNSHGIVYNPLSITKAINDAVTNKKYTGDELLEYNGKWISLNHHGSFSKYSPEESLSIINSSISEMHDFIKKANFIIITPGTAWYYIHRNTGTVAGNCHRLPQADFSKKILSVGEITNSFNESLSLLKQFNENIKIIFTVSPVRHWKDGAHENQLSKATLLLAIDQVMKENINVNYFPSYEILMDELRDYRFYGDDMLHPSGIAVDYIWNRFCDTYMAENTLNTMKEISKIRKTMSHSPMDNNREVLKRHYEKIESMKKNFSLKYPDIDTFFLNS